ncbi:hypothetical protein BH11ARM2_BH11ARM2_14540 [soil metagenome]
MLGRRDWLGSLIGLGVFALGIFLLYGTFKLADAMFVVPANEALGIQKGRSVDFSMAGANLTTLIVRCLLLLIMGLVGSLIAGKGVALYAGSLHPKDSDASRVPTPVPAEERISTPEG